jgi:hypothetical protein
MFRKKIMAISLLIALLILFFISVYRAADESPYAENYLDKSKSHRMIVFIHGTFGAVVGLTSFPSLLSDSLSGTFYKKTLAVLRKKKFFYATQPLLGLGLTSFKPSLENSPKSSRCAIKPISQSYDHIANYVSDDPAIRHYYAFGWSGLLSQKSRQKESIRLMNQLHQEVLKFRREGINPQITLLCHSHGGNVALNMGIISSLLTAEKNELFDLVSSDSSICENKKLLNRLPEFGAQAKTSDEKRWDYRPAIPDWHIDQLTLLATPLQEETDFAAVSSFFNNVHSYYSFDDHIQGKDLVTTKKLFSEQRFNRIEEKLRTKNLFLPPGLKQLRIMCNREFSQDETRIIPRGAFLNDPGHKEFWFIVFPLRFNSSAIKPLPVVTLCPLIDELLRQEPLACDVDINISSRGLFLSLSMQHHGCKNVLVKYSVEKTFFENLRQSLYQWRQKGFVSQFLESIHLL